MPSITYLGKTLHYQKTGMGKAVMLLHGFGEDASIFQHQITALEDKYTVLVPHLPGIGLSDFNAAIVSIADMALAINAILLHENIETCVMLGHSMGGYITLAFADKFPKKITGFALIHSSALADNEEKKESRTKAIALMQEHGGAAFLRNTIPNLFSKESKKDREAAIDNLINTATNFATETLQHFYKLMINRPDRQQVLTNADVPVLFIIGEEDAAVLLKDVMPQTKMPKIAYITILENVGHMGMLEATEKVNDSILHFLETISD